MKFSALALIASVQAFPSFDSFHAHCQIETTTDKSCADTYKILEKTLLSLDPDHDPAHGTYTKYETKENQELWFTRLTGGKKYTDDMEFTFADNGSGCSITGKSRSQSLSYYDYQTNYCNMYNPLRVAKKNDGLNFSEPQNKNCKFPADPAQREAQCDAN